MKVLLDTNVLIYLIDFRSGGKAVDRDRRDKLRGLLAEIQEKRGTLLIPTPVLAEYLANLTRDAGKRVLQELRSNRRIQVAPFDEVAAHEAALLHREARHAGGGRKRAPLPESADWQQIKVDWQVIAIAKVHRARILTNDGPLYRMAVAALMPVDLIDELLVPDAARQLRLVGMDPQASVALAVPPSASTTPQS